MRCHRKLIVVGAAAFGALFSRSAWSQTPLCSDATMFPHPVVLAGSTAYMPAAGRYAALLKNLSTPITVIYTTTLGSCSGLDAVAANNGLSSAAQYFVSNGSGGFTAMNCTLDNQKPDFGVSDIFWDSCVTFNNTAAQPSDVKDFPASIQAMLFIVPKTNTTFKAISAEQAQSLWGCGATAAGVAPFTDPLGVFARTSSSGTQGIIAAHIGVPANAFVVADTMHMLGKGGDMVNAVSSAVTGSYGMTHPDVTIGFLAGDAYNTAKTGLNALAFRAFNQTKAYFADSVQDNGDRRNVRDGHYLPWGPEHFYAHTGTDGKPLNADAMAFYEYITGARTDPTIDNVTIDATAGVVPRCAMKVNRDSDGGLLRSEIPADPCGCAFEKAATGSTPAGCTACTGNGDCTGGKTCHHNFCE